MERIIKRLLSFTRNRFTGPSSDIEAALRKTGGAIFLQRVGKNYYNPQEEGKRLLRVLRVLFPKATLEALRTELNKH